MCGRYGLSSPSSQIVEAFQLSEENKILNKARYNIAPCEAIPVINQKKEILFPYWGVKHPVNNKLIINARLENLPDSPLWSKGERTVAPASFFYEWQMSQYGKKVPWAIMPRKGPFLRLAALYFPNQNTSVILTTQACNLLKTIHNHGSNKHRQPMVLDELEYSQWLTGELEPSDYKNKNDSHFSAEEIEQVGDDRKEQPFREKRQQDLF